MPKDDPARGRWSIPLSALGTVGHPYLGITSGLLVIRRPAQLITVHFTDSYSFAIIFRQILLWRCGATNLQPLHAKPGLS